MPCRGQRLLARNFTRMVSSLLRPWGYRLKGDTEGVGSWGSGVSGLGLRGLRSLKLPKGTEGFCHSHSATARRGRIAASDQLRPRCANRCLSTYHSNIFLLSSKAETTPRQNKHHLTPAPNGKASKTSKATLQCPQDKHI